jgi:hypothetical protein
MRRNKNMTAYEDYLMNYNDSQDDRVYENDYLEREARIDEQDDFGTDEAY